MSHINILKSKGPNIDPCEAPNKISLQELKESLIFTLRLRLERQL